MPVNVSICWTSSQADPGVCVCVCVCGWVGHFSPSLNICFHLGLLASHWGEVFIYRISFSCHYHRHMGETHLGFIVDRRGNGGECVCVCAWESLYTPIVLLHVNVWGLPDAAVQNRYRRSVHILVIVKIHKKERLKFRGIKIVKTQMLHTSLICPFSVLACPTVIFLKKRSFVSTTEKQKQKDSLISWKISHEIYYFELENWRNIRDTQNFK